MQRSLHIGLAFGLDYEFSRATLRGVISYARPSKPWVFHMFKPDPASFELEEIRRCDGFLGMLGAPKVALALRASGKPGVNVSNQFQTDVPTVGTDDLSVGRTAAHYFLDRGYRNFAFVGLSGHIHYAKEREAGFTSELAIRGHTPASFPEWLKAHNLPPDVAFHQIRQWIADLPRPLAVFCATDVAAWTLAEVCRDAGIAVPEAVSILGVDNDAPYCTAAFPPLSSIALPGERIGFQAAAVLDELLQGRKPETQRFPSKQVVTRQSSDTLALGDADLAMAVRFIRQHAGDRIGVQDVVAATKVARRSLERKFRVGLGCSPLEEIRRSHLERTRELLVNTDLTMPEIAQRSGFDSAVRMTTVFREEMAMTPSQFRRQYRMRSGEEPEEKPVIE